MRRTCFQLNNLFLYTQESYTSLNARVANYYGLASGLLECNEFKPISMLLLHLKM